MECGSEFRELASRNGFIQDLEDEGYSAPAVAVIASHLSFQTVIGFGTKAAMRLSNRPLVCLMRRANRMS